MKGSKLANVIDKANALYRQVLTIAHERKQPPDTRKCTPEELLELTPLEREDYPQHILSTLAMTNNERTQRYRHLQPNATSSGSIPVTQPPRIKTERSRSETPPPR